ncbi:hypothetical protein [Sphingobium aquiterrae]|uniref:hypothetical protein n=1 Tax=Sphingobium aquiterrae TaxID=2038656 RepID=UPI003016BCC1
MLDIAKPRLTDAEWDRVKSTLSAVSDCGCGTPSAKASRPSILGRAVNRLIGEARPRPALPPQLEAVRTFLCESGRSHSLAEQHIPTLSAQGFTRAQIEAMALLGA